MAKANHNPAAPAAPAAPAETVPSVQDNAGVDAPASVASSEGVRARRAFMLKHLIPHQDWINTNIVAKGKGTKALIGRVFGVCMETIDKKNTLPDGTIGESVAMKGAFQAESYLTGEISEATVVYLPMAYTEKVKAIFVSDEADAKKAAEQGRSHERIQVIEVDCDVGIEATGKTIPYEWVVIAYREGEQMAALKRLRSSRGRPADAPKLLPKSSQAALTGPAS